MTTISEQEQVSAAITLDGVLNFVRDAAQSVKDNGDDAHGGAWLREAAVEPLEHAPWSWTAEHVLPLISALDSMDGGHDRLDRAFREFTMPADGLTDSLADIAWDVILDLVCEAAAK